MGQKVHPTGIRLGVVKDHNSVWYADSKKYASQLVTDLEVREYILKRLDAASVSRVVIERPAGRARVSIYSGRPGLIIGKKGQDIEKLKDELSKNLSELIKSGKPTFPNIYGYENTVIPDLERAILNGEDVMNNQYAKSIMKKMEKKNFKDEVQASKWVMSEVKKLMKFDLEKN